jgi:ABC-2 type transport system ATP-binding protein
MAEDPAVRVHDLWEEFTIYHDRPLTLRERVVGRNRTKAEQFWALKGISVDVARGETVSLIGPNGSGKSTLLKCIARILRPTKGTVEVNGRVAALLELGAGFHGDLTGRENVFLNASILGYGKEDVSPIFDDIVGFAELEEFIDTPVRNYSSGMYVRLGFSVAVHLEPEVFLVDEVLAVGDARFQARCFDRIRQMQRAGTTIVFVTHDLDAASSLSKRVVVLEGGEITDEGPSHKVADRYRQRMADLGQQGAGRFLGGEVHGSGEMTLRSIRIDGADGNSKVNSGSRFSVGFEAEANRELEDPVFGIIVRANDGSYLFDTNTLWRDERIGKMAAGERVSVRFDLTANLLTGTYLITVAAASSDGRTPYDWHTDALSVEISGPTHSRGLIDLEGSVSVERTRVSP